MNSAEKSRQLYTMRLQQAILRHIQDGLTAEESCDRLLDDGYESEEIIAASNSLRDQIPETPTLT